MHQRIEVLQNLLDELVLLKCGISSKKVSKSLLEEFKEYPFFDDNKDAKEIDFVVDCTVSLVCISISDYSFFYRKMILSLVQRMIEKSLSFLIENQKDN